MNRRGFLASILAAGVAPYVSMASGVLMPGRGTIIMPPACQLITPAQIAREALAILEKNLVFLQTPMYACEFRALYNGTDDVLPPLGTSLPAGIEEIKW